MSRIQYLTPEGGLPVEASLIDYSWKGARQYGSIGQKGPLHLPFEEVEKMAQDLKARFILKNEVGSYYIKCYAPRPGYEINSSGEIFHHLSNCYSISGKSRIWIFDYHEE